MYHQVASKLYVSPLSTLYSQAVSMDGGNAVLLDATCIIKAGGDDVALQMQEGNDLENWADVGGTILFGTVGYDTVEVNGIASQYVRVKYETTEDASGILAVGLDVASL